MGMNVRNNYAANVSHNSVNFSRILPSSWNAVPQAIRPTEPLTTHRKRNNLFAKDFNEMLIHDKIHAVF